jgi:uncharacterized protein YecT (DUF1311 family)
MKFRKDCSFILLLFIVLPFLSGAEEPRVNCKSASSTPEENYCAELQYNAVDKELNSLYASYRKKLSEKRKVELKAVQSNWIKLRDSICDFETRPAINGTGWSGFHFDCLNRLTTARIADIRAAMSFEE